MTCNICLKEYKNIIKITTTCKHTFCLDCLSKLNNCPYCRKSLDIKKYFEKNEPRDDYHTFDAIDFFYTSVHF